MYPFSAGLIVQNKTIWEELKGVLPGLPVRVVLEEGEITDWAAFYERLKRSQPDVLFVDLMALGGEFEELFRGIQSLAGGTAIVALHETANPELILRAIRSGACEFVHLPLAANFQPAIEHLQAERTRSHGNRPPGGKLYGFFSAKGGCGATSVACHVSIELRRTGVPRVLLADFDLQSGLIGFLMKSKSPYSLADALTNTHRLDESYWKAVVSNGTPGFEVISAGAAATQKVYPTTDQIHRVLQFARSQYDAVVVDLGRGLTPSSLAALEDMDEIFLVATMEVPAMHRAQAIIQTLIDNGFGRERLRLVLNRMPDHLDVAFEDVQRMLGLPVYFGLPNHYSEIHEAYSEGKLLPENSRLRKSMAALAAKIAGVEPKKKKSIFR